MVRKILKLFHTEISGLHEAAYLIGIASFASQILALFRDRLLAHTFGPGSELDIYYAAFRIPDLIYATIASFVSVNVLIPFLVQWIGPDGSGDRKKAQLFLSSILTVFCGVMVVASLIVFLCAPYLARFVAPGFDEASQATLTTLMRILMLSPFFLGISNIVGGVTQSLKRFYLYALSPLVYNVGIIFGIVVLYPVFGLSGLVWGVALGALLHAGVQFPLLGSAGVFPRIVSKIDWAEIRSVVSLSAPRTLALGLSQISLAVLVALASYMEKGSIAVFNFSFNLQSVPLSIIGVSYSVAAFPALARLYAVGDRARFSSQVATALRHIVFWSLPVTALFFVLRAHIVRTVLGSGHFTWADTRLTAAALALFVISLFAQSVVLLLVRGYYAAGNTSRPLIINLASSVVTIPGAWFLVYLFSSNSSFATGIEQILRVEGVPGTGVLMLPLAFSLGSISNAIALWMLFTRDFAGSPSLIRGTFAQSLFGSLAIGMGAYETLALTVQYFNLETFRGIFLHAVLAGGIGALLGILVLFLIGNKELREISEHLLHKFWRVRTVFPDRESVS